MKLGLKVLFSCILKKFPRMIEDKRGKIMFYTLLFRRMAVSLSLILAALSVTTIIYAKPQKQEFLTRSHPLTVTQKPNTSAQRVVALTSLTTDIVSSLDESKLVGRPDNKLFNGNQKLNKIPIVSQGQTQPNLEKIVALKPDLVVGAVGIHDQTVQKLKQLGINTVLVQVNNWSKLEEVTRLLATSINADPTPLLRKYQKILNYNGSPSPSTLVLVSAQPILSPNKNSWAGDMLSQFKMKNLAAQLQGESPMPGYISLSPEKVLQADPEVIILIDMGNNELMQQFKNQSFWSNLRAVKNNQVYTLDYFGLVNPGSIDAIEQASTKLKQIISEKKP